MTIETYLVVKQAVTDFNWSDYGLDIIDDSDEEWIPDLIAEIFYAIEQSEGIRLI
jgi:hypothetical protein